MRGQVTRWLSETSYTTSIGPTMSVVPAEPLSVHLLLQEIAVNGCITKALGGGGMRRPQPR